MTNSFRQRGVVEGFYGRVWEPVERQGLIEALLPFGLNTYLYCPKHEPPLAARVMEPLSPGEEASLGRLARFCRERSIAPWAGLHLEPPLDVATPEHLQATAQKCAALHALGFSGFIFLFDDIPAATPGGPPQGSLAKAQAHAVREILARSQALGVQGDWLVCPSLYTQDPILEKEYGPFEKDYLRRLDAGMPEQVAWVWTGPRVVSRSIDPDDLKVWRAGSTREVVLWDNYPVNDASMVDHLHLAPLRGRSPELPRDIRGYLFNPMLQPGLGALPGATCLAYAADPRGYRPQQAWQAALAVLLPREVATAMGELEALTSHPCFGDPLPWRNEDSSGTLATALQTLWMELADNRQNLPGNTGAETLATLAVTQDTLQRRLPPQLADEAAPWLARLTQALAVFRAALAGEPTTHHAQAYRTGKARVLGDWFQP